MTFDDWCAAAGGYLNDSDDAAKAARLMARRAWNAAVAAERKRLARDEWTPDFREDPDAPGCGTYLRCPYCGSGEPKSA